MYTVICKSKFIGVCILRGLFPVTEVDGLGNAVHKELGCAVDKVLFVKGNGSAERTVVILGGNTVLGDGVDQGIGIKSDRTDRLDVVYNQTFCGICAVFGINGIQRAVLYKRFIETVNCMGMMSMYTC